MTRAQRAEFAEWTRQRANDLRIFEAQDFRNPAMEAALSGVDFELYLKASIQMQLASEAAFRARKDFEALKDRIEANAD